MKPLIIRLPIDLHREFKLLSVANSTPMQTIVANMIKKYLLEAKKRG
jgi:predicted DNA-binding protein